MLKQNHPVVPPQPSDKSLTDFAGSIQRNMDDLFEAAHSHVVKSSLPRTSDGSPQDIAIVDDGMNVFIAVRTTRGWFRTPALTAI